MVWFRVDDGFGMSEKLLKVPRCNRASAVGVWTLAGAWAARELTDGFVPGYALDEIPGGDEWAPVLASAGLWHRSYAAANSNALRNADSNAGPPSDETVSDANYFADGCHLDPKWAQIDGWLFHDWHDYQPSKEKVTAERDANAARQKAFRERKRDAERNGVTNAVSNAERNGVSNAVSNSTPTRPVPTYNKTSALPRRDDIETICDLLATRVEGNGVKRPTVTDAWRQQARLLIDTDGYPLTEIIRVINWCQDDVTFWAGNIQAMPKFRKQFGQLLVKSRNTATGTNGSPTTSRRFFGKPGEGKSYY
jgi:hypothetical protein